MSTVLVNIYDFIIFSVFPVIVFMVGAAALFHAVVYKHDPRSAAGWAAVIFFFPFFGALLYYFFGINRVNRAAFRRRGKIYQYFAEQEKFRSNVIDYLGQFTACPENIEDLEKAVYSVTHQKLRHGNSVESLINGDEAYPAMLDSIDKAARSISFMSYVFKNDSCGKRFVKALSDAADRGVEVRVLIDDMGSRYSFPPIGFSFRETKVKYATFMKTFIPWNTHYVNMRNHRKIMVVDGKTAYTGGMNILQASVMAVDNHSPVQDTHFKIEGPVVRQFQDIFADDWRFTTGEMLEGDRWYPEIEGCGDIFSRVINAGPDEDIDKLRKVVICAINAARYSVRIQTPYFLPDIGIIGALVAAALRGVKVDILLPQANNLIFVKWAMMAHLWGVVSEGCNVWMLPPPFDHTKLMIVDDDWCMVGSANWDPRSFRINFETNIECYSKKLAASLTGIFDKKVSNSSKIDMPYLNRRPRIVKFRDGLVRLFMPYL